MMNREYEPLNENVLIRAPKHQQNNKTNSGIVIAMVEQDIMYGEVLKVGPGCWRETQEWYMEKDENNKKVFRYVDVVPGDLVVWDKTFFHIYNLKERNRVENSVLLEEDEEYFYYLVRANDILLTMDSYDEVKNIHGYLFSACSPKSVKLNSQKGKNW